jgi:hypothetical protein
VVSVPLVAVFIASGSYAVAIWGGMAFLIVVGALEATVSAVMYHDLRVNKEGIASEELAAVFD